MMVNIIKAQLDMYTNRYDDIDKKIQAVSELSSEYWLLTVLSDLDTALDEEGINNLKAARLLEAKIEGLLQQILLFDEQFRPGMPARVSTAIDAQLPRFIDALTGGDFKSRTGVMDTQRAVIVQSVAASLITTHIVGLRERYGAAYWTRRMILTVRRMCYRLWSFI